MVYVTPANHQIKEMGIYYTKRRAELVNQASNINGKFFPRCLHARLMEIARLDADHDNRPYKEVEKEIFEQWGVKKK